MRAPMPAGALRETRSTCPYCGTGCGVIVQARGDAIVGVRGDPEHPANFGKLCPKGQTLHLTATPAVVAQSRLLDPQLRATRRARGSAGTRRSSLRPSATPPRSAPAAPTASASMSPGNC